MLVLFVRDDEQGADQSLGSLVCQQDRFPASRLGSNTTVRSAPLQIFAGSRTISQIELGVKAYARHTPDVAAVFVDYLQQVRSDIRSDSREQAVADVSRRLKLLAMDIGRPIIVASQLSRAAGQGKDTKSDVTPKLHHLQDWSH